jgi:hypothetical protein
MTVQNVNDLMTWLNNKFSLNLPMLPASPYQGWAGALVTLWKMAVTFVAGSPVQAKVPITGTWSVSIGPANFTLSGLSVEISETS